MGVFGTLVKMRSFILLHGELSTSNGEAYKVVVDNQRWGESA